MVPLRPIQGREARPNTQLLHITSVDSMAHGIKQVVGKLLAESAGYQRMNRLVVLTIRTLRPWLGLEGQGFSDCGLHQSLFGS